MAARSMIKFSSSHSSYVCHCKHIGDLEFSYELMIYFYSIAVYRTFHHNPLSDNAEEHVTLSVFILLKYAISIWLINERSLNSSLVSCVHFRTNVINKAVNPISLSYWLNNDTDWALEQWVETILWIKTLNSKPWRRQLDNIVFPNNGNSQIIKDSVEVHDHLHLEAT